MKEEVVVKAVANSLMQRGYAVGTEIANFYRSADIAAIDNKGDTWIIECKISDMKRAIKQLSVHKQSADRVFIATPKRKMKRKTIRNIRDAGIGLIIMHEDGNIKIMHIDKKNEPWEPAKENLKRKIMREFEKKNNGV